MQIKISHKINLVVTMEGERKTVELTFPKVKDTDKLKSLIRTAKISNKRDSLLFSWFAVYFLIYGKMPKHSFSRIYGIRNILVFHNIIFPILKQIPISKLTYLPSLFTSLDKIAEVI